jgi:hypothetical protein
MAHLDAEQLTNELTLEQLKVMAKDMGVEATGLRSKKDYAEAIAAVEVDLDDPAQEPEGTEIAAELDDTIRKRVVYMGPNLPGGLLTRGKILSGTEKSLDAFLQPVKQKYPKALRLIVPQSEEGKARRALADPKSLLSRYYKELEK